MNRTKNYTSIDPLFSAQSSPWILYFMAVTYFSSLLIWESLSLIEYKFMLSPSQIAMAVCFSQHLCKYVCVYFVDGASARAGVKTGDRIYKVRYFAPHLFVLPLQLTDYRYHSMLYPFYTSVVRSRVDLTLAWQSLCWHRAPFYTVGCLGDTMEDLAP